MNKSAQGYADDILSETVNNPNFRKVLYTGQHMQLVVMTLQPGEDIGSEVHAEHDQFFRVESGSGKAVINGEETAISDDWAVVVPAGAEHNIINTGPDALKLYTIYAPPEHPADRLDVTKPAS